MISLCVLQAAIGSIALDIAIERNEGPEAERLGREVILSYCTYKPFNV